VERRLPPAPQQVSKIARKYAVPGIELDEESGRRDRRRSLVQFELYQLEVGSHGCHIRGQSASIIAVGGSTAALSGVLGEQFPCSNTVMKLAVTLVVIFLCSQVFAQTSSNQTAQSDDYSGMYTFQQEGEFVQITVEDEGRVTGFVSRYGDGESDRGAFLDQFFKDGKLEGKKLTFTTQTVHSVWYEFKGTAERGSGKSPNDEGYHILKGTLTEFRTDVNKKNTSKSHEVVFKSFPQSMEPSSKD